MLSLIYGPDIFRARAYILQQISQSTSSIPTISLDGQIIDPAKLFAELEPTQLFATQKNIILKNILANKNKTSHQTLKTYLTQPNPDLHLFIWEQSELDKRSWLYKFFQKKSVSSSRVCQYFPLLSTNQLNTWLQQYCAQHNINIDSDAIACLTAKNRDTYWLSQEINKLKLFSDNHITRQHVEQISPYHSSDVIFDLTDHLGQQHYKEAYRIAQNLVRQGEDQFQILSTLATHVQNLLVIKDLQSKHFSSAQIKDKTFLHPFVLQKCFNQIDKFSFSELANLYHRVAQADVLLKTGQTDWSQAIFNIIFSY
ncbi:MAG TPA: DNA polymerase III subunit delta [bacterium]|nr:DNA polymerase III subunit delta [bacterium]HPN67236.1 DNA polymerase III subunit delta [bacterium]